MFKQSQPDFDQTIDHPADRLTEEQKQAIRERNSQLNQQRKDPRKDPKNEWPSPGW
jgi:hypothetical protein